MRRRFNIAAAFIESRLDQVYFKLLDFLLQINSFGLPIFALNQFDFFDNHFNAFTNRTDFRMMRLMVELFSHN